MIKKMGYRLFCFLLSVSLCSLSYAYKIDKIIAFGDSMTDNGNIYKLTSEAHRVLPVIPVIPKTPPYYKGRFSNGPIWVDNLSDAMNVPLEDYAYGGSWAEPIVDSKLNVPFGLEMQVTYYLFKSALDFNKSRHLYIIWSGANDYIQGRDDAEYATSNTVATIEKEIEWLIYYGAKYIYVLNIPNLGLIPEVTASGPDFAQKVGELTKLHNKKLSQMIKRLRKEYPDVKLISGDTSSYFEDIMVNPSKYSLKNVTDSCYGGGYWLKNNLADINEIKAAKEANIDILKSPSLREAYLNSRLGNTLTKNVCGRPQEYLFWDHIHPTQDAHRIISDLALKRLNANGIE